MGLLDDVAEAVTRRGQDIMDLIRSGKADEVTREMLDMGDPAMNARLNEYLWNNYDLPMDKASRMERAQGAGFIDPAYRGTLSDEKNTKPQQFVSQDPAVANSYAGNIAFADEIGLPPHLAQAEGGNVMPLLVDKRANSSIVPESYEYKLPSTAIRSAFARFDPRLRHLDNLNAGVAGAAATGAGLLGYGDEANAMPAPQATAGAPAEGDYSLGYRDTLGQLYQTDGGVMYPKGQSAEGLLATVDQPAPEAPQAPLSAFDEALRYYLGPTGIPERIVAANELFNPVRGLERGMVASSQALNPNSGLTGWARVGKGMDATTETLGALLGFGGAKTAIEGAAPLIDDALKAGARFGAEESGAVNLGGLYNAIGRVPDEALANATPFRRTGAENFAEPRRAAGRAKDPALYTEFSTLKQDQIAPYDWEVTGRKLAGMEEPSLFMRPEDIAARFDAIYGYPADATLNNVVIDSVNGVQLPFPILQQAGHTYIDNPQLGFASERTAMASRNKAWREAQREGMRVGVTPMVMGPKGGDFSQHLGQTQAQLILGAADKIDPNFMPNVEELRAAGLTGLLDPRLPYVIEHMKGSNRAKVVKALDTSPAMKAGVPSVAATRWATMDPNLVGADLLSSGYRFFEPLASDAIRRHGGELHATYTGAVNKVGPSMTMGDPRPWYLMFPDEALPRMEASTRKGANMPNPQAMPKDLRAFQMNTRLRQLPDQEWVDVNSKYDEILASKGKEAADTYAIDALLARATRKAK